MTNIKKIHVKIEVQEQENQLRNEANNKDE